MAEKGIVVRVSSGSCDVESGSRRFVARYRRSPRAYKGSSGNPVAVGDRVIFTALDGNEAVIDEILARRTKLGKKSRGRNEQVVAANIDYLLCMMAVRKPELSSLLIDKYIAAAESASLEAIILVNKLDLGITPGEEAIFNVYLSLGYRVLRLSALTGDGVNELCAAMAGRLSLIVGQSGVGKSSLINRLLPGAHVATKEVNEASNLGRHSTTFVEMHRTADETYLIDTPGVRGFDFFEMDSADLRFYFREFAKYTDMCKFSKCLHEGEPSCAVRSAVERGEIAAHRYENYLKLLGELKQEKKDAY